MFCSNDNVTEPWDSCQVTSCNGVNVAFIHLTYNISQISVELLLNMINIFFNQVTCKKSEIIVLPFQ